MGIKQPEEITIIGGGYTGAISAILLAKQKDYEGNPLYEVNLLEKNEYLFHGASTAPGRLHLGGEYPKDEQTALECLEGAIVFKQMFGENVLTNIPEVRYLVSKESQASGDLTLKEMVSSYEKVKSRYTELFDRAVEELIREDTSLKRKAPAIIAERLFGYPDDFYKKLEDNEIDSDHWYGGISTNERGLDPIALGCQLEKLLKENSVKIKTNCEVLEINNNGNYITTKYVNEKSIEEEIKAEQVVNAAWDGAYSLNKSASKEKKQPDQNIHLRAIALVDFSECKNPPDYASFGLIGKSGGMLSPFNDKVGLFYSPEAAYIESAKLAEDHDKMPQNWDNYKADEGLKKSYQKALEERYPSVKGARIVGVLIRSTVAFAKELEQRRHCEASEFVEGFHTAISTKATFTVTSALQVLKNVKQRSGYEVRTSKDKVLLPEDFRNLATGDISQSEAKDYAEKRDLPVDIFSQAIENKENSRKRGHQEDHKVNFYNDQQKTTKKVTIDPKALDAIMTLALTLGILPETLIEAVQRRSNSEGNWVDMVDGIAYKTSQNLSLAS